jgi:hypothetical protein
MAHPSPWMLPSRPLMERARLFHAEWRADALRRGWTAGPSVSACRRTHPDLVPWDSLPEEHKALICEAVQRMVPSVRVALN